MDLNTRLSTPRLQGYGVFRSHAITSDVSQLAVDHGDLLARLETLPTEVTDFFHPARLAA